jgi:poly-gamma-glutamate capsule biosynthesis protein CapA/YwtB (metallophosphatase superfamily)
VSSSVRWCLGLLYLCLLMMASVVGCAAGIEVATVTPSSDSPTAAPPASALPCLAVTKDLWEPQKGFFDTLQGSHPWCPVGPAKDSSQALAWLASGNSRMVIISTAVQQEQAELIRAVPFVPVAHVSFPLDDVSATWLQDVFQEGRPYRAVVVGDGLAERELLGIDELAGDLVHVSTPQEAAELVAQDRRAVALLSWEVVDFHVKVLAVDGQRGDSGGLESYPYVRRWWLCGQVEEYPEMARALEENLASEPGPLVSLVAVGDVMLGRGVGSLMAANSPSYPFLDVQEQISKADVAFANLECAISTEGPQGGTTALVAPPEAVGGLAGAGFDIVSLANNHSDDCGEKGLLDAFDAFEANGIAYVGAGRDATGAYSPVILDVGGLRLAFLAYNHVEPRPVHGGIGIGLPAWLDPEVVYENVREARSQADFVVVSFHWGTEYIVKPDESQQEVARRAVEEGAGLVLGHHSHVMGGVEYLDHGFVAYSLGNFVFDQSWSVETKQGLLLQALIGAGGLKQVRLIPVQIEDGQPRTLRAAESRTVLSDLFHLSQQFGGLPGGPGTGSDLVYRQGKLQPDWVVEVEDPINVVEACDIDSDGRPEILVGTGSALGPGGIFALDGDGALRWQLETDEQVAALGVNDLDGDGTMEVVGGTGMVDTPGWIYAVDHRGRLRWRYGVEASVKAIAVGDVDGEGGLDVVGGEWGSFDDTVYTLASAGTLRWKYQTDGSVNALRVGDVTGRGGSEVIVGADAIYLLGNDGRQLWRYATTGYVNDLALGDLNGDGVQDIVAGTAYPDPAIVGLTGARQVLWGTQVSSSARELVTVDVDGDAREEIAAGSADGTVYLLDDDGGLLWEYRGASPINGLALADVDGDGVVHLAAGTGDFLSPGGACLLDIVTGTVVECYEVLDWVSALAATDVDGDGRDEILIGTGTGQVVLLRWTQEEAR